ncbi:MAG: hypothetical protein AAGG81_00825 [Chlamydiota bacterium]
MSQKNKTFKVVTLGCRTNQYESQAYQNQLEALGYDLSEGDDQPDICIVNTCTVTESADTSSRYQIRQLAKNTPTPKLLSQVVQQITNPKHLLRCQVSATS